jgi:hypothetical protein
MLSKLRRLTDLPLVEQTLLLQLTVLLLGLRVALSAIPLPRLMSLFSRMASSPLLNRIPWLHIRCTLDRLVTLLDLATAVSLRNGGCLPRSLLLFWLLRARRQPASVCLGVTKEQTSLEGHAWVEQDGAVLGDTRSFIHRYTLMLRLPA